jgi:sulfatase maturation enzyme AslB (radical SAM superfamily)
MMEYMNSDIMRGIRNELLNGNQPALCTDCHYESNQNKVSGRQRQLLKSAITEDAFEKTFCASPHWDNFAYSADNDGLTQTAPVDLQIDLGNTCNSACIMCPPRYSSRVTEDHKKLHTIYPDLFTNPSKLKNWTDDPTLVDKFIEELSNIDNLHYIHFLGGETLYLKSFYDICNRLIDAGLAKTIIMGTTTNCTVYDSRIEHIIENFKQVHLGLSVESISPLNDYIRWPSKSSVVTANMQKFLKLREQSNLFVSLRITPNIFSIWQIDQIFEYMIEHSVIAESCNILYDPSCLRMELLPTDLRQQILSKINNVIEKHQLVKSGNVIINRRRTDIINPVISAVIFEYKEFLENYLTPTNIEEERKNLTRFIRAYEDLHQNNILEHLPEYEEFLRSYGY